MLFRVMMKDFILVKKYLIGMFIAAFVLPVYINGSSEWMRGSTLAFFLTSFIIQLLLFNLVSMLEYKNKGSTHLCATPYTRNSLVKAKYLFNLAVFAVCSLVYTLTAVIWPAKMAMLHLSTFALSLLTVSVVFGIIIPVQYRLGYEKAKYIFMSIIMLTPFLLPNLLKVLERNNFSLRFSLPFPGFVQDLFPLLLAAAIGIISMMISDNIFAKEEL